MSQRYSAFQTLPVRHWVAHVHLFGEVDVKRCYIVGMNLTPSAVEKMTQGQFNVTLQYFFQPTNDFMIDNIASAVEGKSHPHPLFVICRLFRFGAKLDHCVIIPYGSQLRTFMAQPEGEAPKHVPFIDRIGGFL